MSHNNYIRNLLNIKDNNIKFFDDFFHIGFRKGKSCNIFNAFLSYIPDHCDKCGVIFNSKKDFEKKALIKVLILLSLLFVKRIHIYFWKNKELNAYIVILPLFVKPLWLIMVALFLISLNILLLLIWLKKEAKKILLLIITFLLILFKKFYSYYESQKLYKHYLPEVLSFDEFKSVKSASFAMSFHLCDGTNGKIIDIAQR